MNDSKNKPSERYGGREDWRRFIRMVVRFDFMFWVAIIGVLLAVVIPSVFRLFRTAPTVVVYAAQDQVYAEPILQQFERETGIRVRTLFDSEAVKTVGLANRLLAERAHPRCDVFWGNEELRTRQLAAKGVFRETNGWAEFGYRSRRVAMSAGGSSVPAPVSWRELTNEIYRGRIALAYPAFGSTATHLLALRQHWGESNWLNWCRALAANEPLVVDGNSMTVQFVARGEAAIGLTDSDDVVAANREGAKLLALPLVADSLLIPNTVAVIRNGPNPGAAQRLFEFLQRGDVVKALVNAGALEGASSAEVATATLRPDWDGLLRDLDSAATALIAIFRK